jgi:hypothetical protein
MKIKTFIHQLKSGENVKFTISVTSINGKTYYYTHKKLEYVIFFEQKQRISKVSDLYINVMSFLFAEQPQMFFTSDLGERVGLTKNKNIPRQAVAINETYFVEANLDNKGKFERIKYALTKAGITDELFIKYAN